MLGPFSTRRALGLYLLVWLMLALMLAGLVHSTDAAAWSNSLLFAVPVTMMYAFATGFSAFYLCRAYPLAEKSPTSIVLVFAATAFFAGALWAAICMAWNTLLQVVTQDSAGIALALPLRTQVVGLGMLLYGLTAVAHYLAIEFERARLAERRELESKLLAQDAELRMLRTQIDPHFLFNSLNSISALTSLDARRARQMTLQLADFFRASLSLEASRNVTLAAEAQLVGLFLAIEKVRFGARLSYEEQIDDGAGDCLLPPMILQPLVENAVKHGIGNLADGGCVRVTARRAGSVLHVCVANDVDPDQAVPRVVAGGLGIGLANVRQRLATAYGREASVHWTRDGATFRVELTLPANIEGAA
jgi:two-component system sensor histidine kinase AlgZ